VTGKKMNNYQSYNTAYMPNYVPVQMVAATEWYLKSQWEWQNMCNQYRSKKEIDQEFDINKIRITEDIRTEKELQKQTILKDQNGGLRLAHDAFTKKIEGDLGFSESKATIYMHMDDKNIAALHVEVIQNNSAQSRELWMKLTDYTDRTIRKAFDKAKINFGFRKGQEWDVQRLLIVFFINNADRQIIPAKYGWCKWDGKFVFIKRGCMTWKEVERYVGV
jgi:hypothetical protein